MLLLTHFIDSHFQYIKDDRFKVLGNFPETKPAPCPTHSRHHPYSPE